MSTIRVLVADDHSLVRAGIRSLIENVEGAEVVAGNPIGKLLASLCIS